MKPIFIWAGGKNKLISKYAEKDLFPKEGSFDTFVEPFFGGGALTIFINETYPKVKNFIINDINAEIMQLYRIIKTDLNKFLTELDGLQDDYLRSQDRKIFFYAQRKRYTEHYQGLTETQESALLYFLMRTAFNGLWQSTIKAKGRFATPSGLLKQKDSVYDKENVIKWSRFLNEKNVVINSETWQKSIPENSCRTFFFFDPPYRDSFTQYGTVFSDQNHVELLEAANKLAKNNNTVFVCNRLGTDNFFENNRGILNIDTFPVTYTAGRRATKLTTGEKFAKKAEEILLWHKAQ
jgi:DNA adenine methylase